MRGLLEFADRPAVRGVVHAASALRRVQGVVAEYDPLWLTARHLDTEEWERRLFWWDRFGYGPYPPELPSRCDQWVGLGESDDVVLKRWRTVRGSDEPYRLRICLRPDETDEGEALLEIPSEGVKLVFERRPLARMTADFALSARVAGSRGTVGGAIRSPNGDWLGVTCGHVVAAAAGVELETGGTLLDQLALAVAGRPRIRGECVRRTSLVELAEGSQCNPYGPLDPSNAVDAALVRAEFGDADFERYEGLPINRANVSSGQLSTMLATDGRRNGFVGGLGIYYVLHERVGTVTKAYCFRHIFEFLAPPHTAKLVHKGDSGAWIMRPGAQGDGWLGVVLGSDDLRGFAMFAQTVHEWATAIP